MLMYHSVSASLDTRFGPWCVEPELFARQIRAVRVAGYRLCGLTEALAAHAAGEAVVALTFDDGYEDFADAANTLERFDAAATIYVVTGLVGFTARWLPFARERQRRLLGWPELVELARAGIEIGAHGHEHIELDAVPLSTARDDITASREAVLKHVGAVSSFCYPFGYHDRTIRGLVESAGFTNACEVGYALHQPSGNPFRISRLMVTNQDQPSKLADSLSRPTTPIGSVLRAGVRPAWRTVRRARHSLSRVVR